MFDNVTFELVDNNVNHPIKIRVGNKTQFQRLTAFGEWYKTDVYHDFYTKCVIFPKGKTTWEGFIPPYEFKDGDILAYDNTSLPSTVFIYRNYNPDWNTGYFVALSGRTGKFYKEASGALDYYNPNVRFATEEEKERLFRAIESKGYKWNPETKTLEKLIVPKFKVGDKIISIVNEDCEAPAEKGVISKITDDMYVFTDGSFIFFSSQDEWELVPNKFDISTLVSFEDKVLVRDEETDKWMPATWGFYEDSLEFNYTVEGGNSFNMCIPYKGNEHLLGTKDDCDNFYKTWEEEL